VVFADRDHIHAGAQIAQMLEHGEVGIGLDRVADQMRQRRQRLGEELEMAGQRRGRIAVEGRAHGIGDVAQHDSFGVQLSVMI
jgi:hypothetical protein